MKLNSDKKVWEEFKNKKDEALSYIYYQNVDFLFFYGKKFTSDEELILDQIQDLFFYLIKKRKTLGDTENIRMYLLKSFRRRLFVALKKKAKQQELKNAYQPESKIIFSVEEKLISAEEQSEKNMELRRGMQKLNASQREVLYYKFNCGMDYNQICEIMNLSYDSARQMVSRSIHSLKKYLSEKGVILMFIFGPQKK